ncbi:MAG: bifunctional riboflavin kinase/FAD synthetase [Anaerolineaceae bacterium]|nr:bifunctional riboflavin kinase/FAD synthetase [Anaerolineaceae bacterium]
MIFFRELTSCNLEASSIAIGSFDGVHLGHRALINQMVKSAKAQKIASLVINFFPQPVVVLNNLKSDYYITNIEERRVLIEELDTDYLLTLPFTYELASLTAEEFLTQLHTRFGMQEIWLGEEFKLGRDCVRSVSEIRGIGEKLGFVVHMIGRVKLGDEIISSSKIRQALRDGELITAEKMLGRRIRLISPVVHGAHRGRTIGYPTANLEVDSSQVYLHKGVYWTSLTLEGIEYPSITSVGTNPTFVQIENPPISVETHILDFDEDIYDKIVKIEFLQFIRDEKTFNSVPELVKQIDRDVEIVRGLEANAAKTTGIFTRPTEI